jgi:hypothetical protein
MGAKAAYNAAKAACNIVLRLPPIETTGQHFLPGVGSTEER